MGHLRGQRRWQQDRRERTAQVEAPFTYACECRRREVNRREASCLLKRAVRNVRQRRRQQDRHKRATRPEGVRAEEHDGRRREIDRREGSK